MFVVTVSQASADIGAMLIELGRDLQSTEEGLHRSKESLNNLERDSLAAWYQHTALVSVKFRNKHRPVNGRLYSTVKRQFATVRLYNLCLTSATPQFSCLRLNHLGNTLQTDSFEMMQTRSEVRCVNNAHSVVNGTYEGFFLVFMNPERLLSGLACHKYLPTASFSSSPQTKISAERRYSRYSL
jgi:hypothetical protein